MLYIILLAALFLLVLIPSVVLVIVYYWGAEGQTASLLNMRGHVLTQKMHNLPY